MKNMFYLMVLFLMLSGCGKDGNDSNEEAITGDDTETGDDTSYLERDNELEALQRAFVELRFGMFIHFGIRTFTGDDWATPDQDISAFNPTALDAEQWAAAARSANMAFGVLTAKHHDGFALWDSAVSDYDVANTPWKDGAGDVVQEYVDAFRDAGLLPGLYYSIWDTTREVAMGGDGGMAPGERITDEEMAFIKDQIEELLTGYGPIPVLVIDGWSWKAGHMSVPYEEIHEHVKSLQPECLLMDLTHMHDLWDADIVMYEEPKGVWAPENNTLPGSQCTTIGPGNGWFWSADTATSAMSSSVIVNGHLDYLEPLWVNFILNCPPNREGLMDDIIVNRLAQVGEQWSPDESRPPLPDQDIQIRHYVTPVGAEATSGDAINAIDGINDTHYYSVWESDEGLPQSITIDLGEVREGITQLAYVPRYEVPGTPTDEGSITAFKISVSENNETFEEVASGEWEGDAHMKVAPFPPVPARYIRLEALEANGDFAAATEISIGAAE